MKKLVFISITLSLLSGSSCEKFMEKKYVVRLENQSDTRLYAAVGIVGQGIAGIYPDTALPADKPIFSIVAPKSLGYVIYGPEKITAIFEKLPKDTLSVYVFNADTVDIQDWNIIRNQNKFLRRYDLSLEDLQKLNFVIPFL